MDILIFGIQGSGKGTQATRLAADFDFVLYQPGVELRKIMASGTPLGKAIQSLLDKGNLAPLGVVMEITKMFVTEQAPGKRVLFDGIPRDMSQREGFDAIMSAAGRDFLCVNILISEQEARKRIFGRAQTEKRGDDQNEEAINRRFEIFAESTLQVINYYREQGKLIDVDGMGTVDEVYERLKAAIA